MSDSRGKLNKWEELGIIKNEDAQSSIERIQERLKEKEDAIDECISEIEEMRESTGLKRFLNISDINVDVIPS